jgi:Bifunctional DNA primase/polymerase, N-terminal
MPLRNTPKPAVHIVPTRPDNIKNPGGYVGPGWPKLATDDLDTIRDRWRCRGNAGIALHPGPSGFLVIDDDNPNNVSDWLWKHLNTALFRSTMTDPAERVGHYFFSLTNGQRFGGGLGKLKPSNGKRWGEIKCFGGAIILGPTAPHPKEDQGHAWASSPGGYPPPVPDEIADALISVPVPDAETYRLLTPGELRENAKEFLETYTDNKESKALAPILDNFDSTPNCRHASMFDTLCWAMREAKAGRFSAQEAVDELKALWNTSFGVPND